MDPEFKKKKLMQNAEYEVLAEDYDKIIQAQNLNREQPFAV